MTLSEALMIIFTTLMSIATVAMVFVAVIQIRSSMKIHSLQINHEKNMLRIQREQIVIDELEKLVQEIRDYDLVILDNGKIKNQQRFSDKIDIIIQKSSYYSISNDVKISILAIETNWQSFQMIVEGMNSLENEKEALDNYVIQLEKDVTKVIIDLEKYEESLYKEKS